MYGKFVGCISLNWHVVCILWLYDMIACSHDDVFVVYFHIGFRHTNTSRFGVKQMFDSDP